MFMNFFFFFSFKAIMATEWVMLLAMTIFLIVRPKDTIIDLKGALGGFSAGTS